MVASVFFDESLAGTCDVRAVTQPLTPPAFSIRAGHAAGSRTIWSEMSFLGRPRGGDLPPPAFVSLVLGFATFFRMKRDPEKGFSVCTSDRIREYWSALGERTRLTALNVENGSSSEADQGAVQARAAPSDAALDDISEPTIPARASIRQSPSLPRTRRDPRCRPRGHCRTASCRRTGLPGHAACH